MTDATTPSGESADEQPADGHADEHRMLRTFSAEFFAPHVDTSFRLPVNDEDDLVLTLAEVVGRTGDTVEDAERKPFSMLFRGPVERVFEQQIVTLVHDDLGTLQMFLVPLEPDKEGARYEAVFS